MDPSIYNILGLLAQGQDPNKLPPQSPAAAAPQADPADVGSWLASLGGGTPPDASAPAMAQPGAPPTPQAAPQVNALQQAVPQQQAPQAPATALKARHSILDVLGRVSDVLANVGGAPAQYQPYLDQRQDRGLMLADHAQNSTLNDQKIASNGMDNTAQSNKLLGQALNGVQAIQAAGGDPSKAWPVLAQRIGLDPAHTEAIGHMIAQDPTTLTGLIAELNGDGKSKTGKFGLNLTYAVDPAGKVHAYQVNEAGDPAHEVIFPAGQNPTDGVQVIDTGNAHVMIDKRTGAPVGAPIIKQGGPQPGEVVSTDAQGNPTYKPAAGSRQAFDQQQAAAKLAIEQQKEQDARDKTKPGKDTDPYTVYTGARTQLKMMSDALTDLRNDPALSTATGYVAGAIDTPARQKINAKIAAIKGMSVPVATALLKAQGVSRPAQAEVLSTAAGIISDLGLTRQSTPDYINSIDRAQTNLATRVKGLDAGALRSGIITPKGGAAAAPAPSRALPPRLPPAAGARQPTPAARAPTVSNW